MSEFVAALPMYDWPETRAGTDAEWSRLRGLLERAGIDAPKKLARSNADLPPVPDGIRDREGRAIAPDPATLPPAKLDFHAIWLHPQLLLAQTCWGPLEQGLSDHVVVVGQPDYSDVEGGWGEDYSSAILMRRQGTPPSVLPDIFPSRGEIGSSAVSIFSSLSSASKDRDKGVISPLEGEMSGRTVGGAQAPADGKPLIPLDLIRGKRIAFNSLDSMSGIIALTRDLEAAGENLDIFSGRVETGAHRASVVAVAEGRADLCAIDCRSWALAQRFEPAAGLVEVVGWTGRRKGLPMITSRHTPPEIVAALRQIFSQR